jgi:hypothetical protein
MNKLQKVASDICGSTFEYGLLRAGARDDYYYSCTSKEDKIAQILLYADNVTNVSINIDQANKIFDCLEALDNCDTESGDLFRILSNLK